MIFSKGDRITSRFVILNDPKAARILGLSKATLRYRLEKMNSKGI
jgi:hypothetical protein